MATLVHEDGKVEEVSPQDGVSFHCPELYRLLECDMVECRSIGRNKRTKDVLKNIGHGAEKATQIILDEEGKLTGKGYNLIATDVWAATFDTVNVMLLRTGDHMVGKVLLCTAEDFQ